MKRRQAVKVAKRLPVLYPLATLVGAERCLRRRGFLGLATAVLLRRENRRRVAAFRRLATELHAGIEPAARLVRGLGEALEEIAAGRTSPF